MVCRPNSRALAVSQGKGLGINDAKASGLMESVESYHAEHILLPMKLGTYEELKYTYKTADVDILPHIIRSRFHYNLRLLWIEGYDLLQNERVWQPYEMVHIDCTVPFPTGWGCFPVISNGLASGNNLLEAVIHGICEVVERDSTTLWHMLDEETQERSRIDLDTISDPDCSELLSKYQRAKVKVAVWETTTDLDIPSFFCMISESTDDTGRLLYSTTGMGCHPTRQIALIRALTEAAQSRLTLIAGSRDDAVRSWYVRSRDREVVQRYRSRMEVKGSMRKFHNVPTWNSQTLNEDVIWMLDRLRSGGIKQVIVTDLTKPEFRIPVARIVIPGLEGSDHHPGYSPGARARALWDRCR